LSSTAIEDDVVASSNGHDTITTVFATDSHHHHHPDLPMSKTITKSNDHHPNHDIGTKPSTSTDNDYKHSNTEHQTNVPVDTASNIGALNIPDVNEIVNEEHPKSNRGKKNQYHMTEDEYWYTPQPFQPILTEQDCEDYAAACAATQNILLSLHSERMATKWVTGPIIHTPAFYELIQLPGWYNNKNNNNNIDDEDHGHRPFLEPLSSPAGSDPLRRSTQQLPLDQMATTRTESDPTFVSSSSSFSSLQPPLLPLPAPKQPRVVALIMIGQAANDDTTTKSPDTGISTSPAPQSSHSAAMDYFHQLHHQQQRRRRIPKRRTFQDLLQDV
jgi:hypothetical protein